MRPQETIPWPEQCPDVVLPEPSPGIRKAHRQMLQQLIHENKAATGGGDGAAGMIVELGAATGLLTKALAELAPGAEIVAVDRWRLDGDRQTTSLLRKGTVPFSLRENWDSPRAALRFLDGNGSPLPPWKAMIPRIQQEFFANCWEHRHRIVPLSTTPAAALRSLHHSGADPRLILLAVEHTGEAELEVPLARRLFPQAILAGNGWSWQRARRVIQQTVEAEALTLPVVGDMWSLRG